MSNTTENVLPRKETESGRPLAARSTAPSANHTALVVVGYQPTGRGRIVAVAPPFRRLSTAPPRPACGRSTRSAAPRAAWHYRTHSQTRGARRYANELPAPQPINDRHYGALRGFLRRLQPPSQTAAAGFNPDGGFSFVQPAWFSAPAATTFPNRSRRIQPGRRFFFLSGERKKKSAEKRKKASGFGYGE